MNAPWRLLNRALPVLAAGTVAGWGAMHLDPNGKLATLAGVFAAGLAWPVARRFDRHGAPQVLAWDGQRWVWQDQAAAVSVMLDFGNWLLLRVTQSQGRHWVPVSLGRTQPASALFRAVLRAHAGWAERADD